MSHRTAHRRTTRTPKRERVLWRTHPRLAAAAFERFGAADLDAAATDASVALAPAWIDKRRNALDLRPWAEAARRRGAPSLPALPRAWLNPPWSSGKTGTGAWCDRALFEWRERRLSSLLLLVPEAVDTDWWWRVAPWASVVISLGRVPYLRPSGELLDAPPQGSTLFAFDGEPFERPTVTLERWRLRLRSLP